MTSFHAWSHKALIKLRYNSRLCCRCSGGERDSAVRSQDFSVNPRGLELWGIFYLDFGESELQLETHEPILFNFTECFCFERLIFVKCLSVVTSWDNQWSPHNSASVMDYSDRFPVCHHLATKNALPGCDVISLLITTWN